MDYYIFIWDMYGSSKAIAANEKQALRYLSSIANFCLESVSELPSVPVVPLGDGQQVLFPASISYKDIILPFAESVGRYAKSLTREYPDYQITSLLSKGTLHNSPLGEIGAVLWQLDAAMQQIKPGEFVNLVKN